MAFGCSPKYIACHWWFPSHHVKYKCRCSWQWLAADPFQISITEHPSLSSRQAGEDGNQGRCSSFWPLCSVLLQPVYSKFPSQLKSRVKGRITSLVSSPSLVIQAKVRSFLKSTKEETEIVWQIINIKWKKQVKFYQMEETDRLKNLKNSRHCSFTVQSAARRHGERVIRDCYDKTRKIKTQ